MKAFFIWSKIFYSTAQTPKSRGFDDAVLLFAKSDNLTWWDFFSVVFPCFLGIVAFMLICIALMIIWHKYFGEEDSITKKNN